MTTSEQSVQNFDSLWDYEHPAATEERFREKLATFMAGEAAYVELLTQIARAQGLQRQFDAAHATLDQAAIGLTDEPAHLQVRYHLERGRVFNSAGDRPAAMEHFTTAWSLAQQRGEDYYGVDAAHMLAIVAPPDQQHGWNLKALAVVEQSNDPRTAKWVGSLHNNIGWTDFAAGDFGAALNHFQQALQAREAQGDRGTIQIAHWCVARALRALDRLDEALAIQKQLLTEQEASGESDGYVYEELGECYLALGEGQVAQPYFARAYQLLRQDEWLVSQEGPRVERLKTLGNAAEAA